MKRQTKQPEKSLHKLDVQDRWLELEGLRLHYQVVGLGAELRPPLLLIHGLGLSTLAWHANYPALARWGTVYALDLPGFGSSDKPRQVLTPQELALYALRFVEALQLPPAVWLGHSLGGEICLWAACQRPVAVRAMILAASMGLPPRPGLGARLLGLLRDALREKPSSLLRIYMAYLQSGPWRILRTVMKSQPRPLLRHLHKMTMPALVISGAQDPVVSLQENRDLARRLPNAQWQLLDAPHGMVFSQAEAFNRLTVEFLAGLATAQPLPSPQPSDREKSGV